MTTMTATPLLQVDGVTSRAADGTLLLDEVSFTVEAGWLVAVIGPTGAGKTSLAKALLGQLRLDAGTVRVQGRQGRGRVAGVPQDDTTHAQLTLRRTLDHAAALRVDASPGERRRSVDAVLAELGLTGRGSTRLADLSGGERKRANVAVELLGDPDLLVLDEPTSGLDPSFERSVFGSLRSLADAGRTIIAITHSVQVLAVCDRVLFLAPGGGVAFYGSPDEAEAYFDWDEPADAYAAVATAPQAWRNRFSTTQASRPSTPPWPVGAEVPPAPAPAPPARSTSGHLGTLLHRAWHLASSDRRGLVLSLAAGPVLGLLLYAVLPGGTLERFVGSDGRSGSARPAETFAFFLAMTITWLAAAGAAREVVKERSIVRRERLVGVSLSSYLLGKALFLSAFTAAQVVPLAGFAVLRQQAPGRGPALGSGILEILVVAVVVGVAAVATGLLVSTWATSSEKAMTALPMVLVAQLALAGPWAEDRGFAMAFVRDLIPARWASVAVQATVAGDAGRWWLAVACLTGLVVLQLAAALLLLRWTAAPVQTSATRSLDAFGHRLAAASPPRATLVPVGLAVVLALAAGLGVIGRTSAPRRGAPAVADAALPAPPAAPQPPTVPTTVALAPAPAPAPAAGVPPTAPPTTRAPVVTAPPTTAARRAAAAPRTAATAPAPAPTTRAPTPVTTTPPPASTYDPWAFTNWWQWVQPGVNRP